MINKNVIASFESHSAALLTETFNRVQEHNINQFTVDPYGNISQGFRKLMDILNYCLFIRIGFYLLIKKYVNNLFYKFYYVDFMKWNSIGTLVHIQKNSSTIDKIYHMLSDEESKLTFDWFIQYRIAYSFIGSKAADLFPFDSVNQFGLDPSTPAIKQKNRRLFKVKDYLIESTEEEMRNSWTNEQYRLPQKCEPKEGNIVISIGAFQGESAIWFADKMNRKGTVYAFEPSGKSALIIEKNVRRNHLESVIKIENTALWSENSEVSFQSQQACSKLIKQDNGNKIKTITLDSFVESNQLERIDFIKMDVEGTEKDIIQGAIKTISRFKPKLAISVYHLPDDIIAIPNLIKSIAPEYKLYLSHKNLNWNETVLFASID